MGICQNIPGHAGPATQAFSWQDGAVRYLPGLGGYQTDAVALNNAGQIVGNAADRAGVIHAVEWTAAGAVIELGSLEKGQTSAAYGVNDEGQAVGESLGPKGLLDAVLFQNGGTTDLNSMVPSGFGFHLETAFAINDVGQILADGFEGNTTEEFLLTPSWDASTAEQMFAVSSVRPGAAVPEPAGLAIGVGAAWIAAARRRKQKR